MISPDYRLERKRFIGQLTKWRIFSFALVAIILFTLSSKITGHTTNKPVDYIASITVDGIIMDEVDRAKKIANLAEKEHVKAVILHINSPGGSVVGAEMLYNALNKIAAKKPLVAVMQTVAASGGYLISLAAEHVIAYNGTITGSIGVILETTEITELADKLGVKFENFKSHPLKASPNPLEKTTEQARSMMMKNIDRVYDYFIGLVAEKRQLDLAKLKEINDGSILTGMQAYELKLIDQIGDIDSATKWLHEQKNISEDLKVKEVKLVDDEPWYEQALHNMSLKIANYFSTHFSSLRAIIF